MRRILFVTEFITQRRAFVNREFRALIRKSRGMFHVEHTAACACYSKHERSHRFFHVLLDRASGAQLQAALHVDDALVARTAKAQRKVTLFAHITPVDKHIDKAAIDEFIKGLPVSKEIKMELMAITPENYTGYNY